MNEQLPPLPYPKLDSVPAFTEPGYTADQMRDYARAALAAKVPADPCLVLWKAMNQAGKVGNRTDDKLIVKFLREAGYCIAATPAPAPEAAMLVNGMTPLQFALNELYEFQQATGCDTADEYLAEKAAPAQAQQSAELLPCPFCGHVGLDFADGSTHRWGLASCAGCGATCGETRRTYPPDDKWHASAIKDWNTRAKPEAQQAAEPTPAVMVEVIRALYGEGYLAGQREAKPEAQQSHRYILELPNDDKRTARVVWSDRKEEAGKITHSLCVAVGEAKPEAQQPLTVPHPGSPEASALVDSELALQGWPGNPKKAAQAGYEACRKLLGAGIGASGEAS